METNLENPAQTQSLEARERIIGDLQLLTRDAEDLLKATAGDVRDQAQEVRRRLVQALESAKVTCQRLQDRTAQAAKATDNIIRDHPYESIGIAFGTGLLIGVLAARR